MSELERPPSKPRIVKRAWAGLLWATPGQLDAGFSSLATFAAGIIAVRVLSPEALGAYSLLMSSFHLASQISAELLFTPSQIVAIDWKPSARLGMVRYSLPRGLILSLLSGFIVPLGALPAVAVLGVDELVPLAASAAALAALSPVQDHLRAMFHIADKSWLAAAMSAIHLLTTSAAVFVMSPIFPLWAPFGALAGGNLLSLVFAVIAIARLKPSRNPPPPIRQLTAIGSWLLATGLSKNGLSYAARALLSAVVGTAMLGLVEAARIVAQPINVFALGLMAQVGPRSTEAGARKRRALALKWRSRFVALLVAVAVPYLVFVSFPWDLNPLFRIAPRAYDVAGLTAAMLLATSFSCLSRPLRAELLGARLQKEVTRTTLIAGFIEVGLISAGQLLNAFVVPVGLGIASLAAVALYYRRLNALYSETNLDQSRSLSRL